MDLGFDHDSLLRGPNDSGLRGNAVPSLEWHGLAARLAASHAFRHVHGQAPEAPARMGSFDAAVARLIATYGEPFLLGREAGADTGGNCSCAVNPIDLADLKSASGISETIAGPSPHSPAIEE